MSAPEPVAQSWHVHGLQLAGLCWGDPRAEPLLCLHGWLDNAASFSVLAPLLRNFYVVAPDLTGQGKSDRRSADAGYQIWDDLPEIVGLIETLGWDRFNLLGHSRGAVISTLYASSFPERIKRLVLLDAVSPQAIAEEQFPVQMRQFLDDKSRLLQREHRVFASVSEALASRQERGLSGPAAQALVERNLRPCAGGYTWTTDPRLQGASAVKLTAGQIQAVLNALTMPVLLLLAEQGLGRHPEMEAAAQRHIGDLKIVQVAAGHHFHMENSAPHVAGHIEDFLQ